jgi:hypothetical protein
MAKVIQFPTERVQQNSGSVYAMFSKEVADSFMKYHELGVEWRNNFRKQTFYEGYPYQPPCEPFVEGLVWFTDEQKNFGVWIYNKSNDEIIVNEKVEFGWSPFVRKSVGPPNEPVHIQSADFRKHLVWFVDEDGYGQYGVIQNNGEIWLPHPKQ